jgi:uncharacterized Zn-binding protein involved in type VI secretion|tara:strand:- start:280 stop:1149 length:870 start_codon:yes stop_codon:yes gene_type:complete
MPLIVRDLDQTQGHCWQPAALIANTQAQLPIGQVFINNRLAVVVGDKGTHSVTCGDKPNHDAVSVVGSPTVFVNGFAVVRDGDPMGCGDVADTQGGDVFADGGGNIGDLFPGGIPAGQVSGETVSYVVNGPGALNASWPTITLRGNYDTSNSPATEYFLGWNSSANQPRPANPFTIKITEEAVITPQRTFVSTQGVGAPNLPNEAPPVFRAPLDPFVTFEVISGPFTVDNAGALTLKPSFIPPRHPNDNKKLARDIDIKVRMNYGNQGIVSKEFTVNIRFDLRKPITPV